MGFGLLAALLVKMGVNRSTLTRWVFSRVKDGRGSDEVAVVLAILNCWLVVWQAKKKKGQRSIMLQKGHFRAAFL